MIERHFTMNAENQNVHKHVAPYHCMMMKLPLHLHKIIKQTDIETCDESIQFESIVYIHTHSFAGILYGLIFFPVRKQTLKNNIM